MTSAGKVTKEFPEVNAEISKNPHSENKARYLSWKESASIAYRLYIAWVADRCIGDALRSDCLLAQEIRHRICTTGTVQVTKLAFQSAQHVVVVVDSSSHVFRNGVAIGKIASIKLRNAALSNRP